MRLERPWGLCLTSLDSCRVRSPPTFAFLTSGLPPLTHRHPHSHLGMWLQGEKEENGKGLVMQGWRSLKDHTLVIDHLGLTHQLLEGGVFW